MLAGGHEGRVESGGERVGEEEAGGAGEDVEGGHVLGDSEEGREGESRHDWSTRRWLESWWFGLVVGSKPMESQGLEK